MRLSSEDFLRLARETFDKVLAEAKGDLSKRQEAIDGLVRPLADSLKSFDEHVRELEKTRQGAYAALEELIADRSPLLKSSFRERPPIW